MKHVLGLKCTICGAEYAVGQVAYVCPKHGSEGILDVVYDYRGIARQFHPEDLGGSPDRSIWRYLPLLPVDADLARRLAAGTTLGSVGWTPLYPAWRLAAQWGLRYLWVKDDGRQPTASFKDRASAIAVVKACELGYEVITTASTGNAAAALSGLCAAVDRQNGSAEPMRSVIFVPRTAPQAKIAQLLVHGSTVLLVDGTYDQAFELCLQAAPTFGWYNRNTAYNPYMSEGKKTAAYEICEQLGIGESGNSGIRKSAQWEAPDVVIVPVGDGCIIGGMHKGFKDLLALGWIDHVPRLIGVQAAGSSPLVEAWQRTRGEDLDPLQAALEMRTVAVDTLADSISAGLPRDRIKALRAVAESQGTYLRVSDDEILAAIPALARGCGVFAEPAAAAAYAGLAKAVTEGLVTPNERIVVLSTGSGLKDVSAAIRSVIQPPVISPDLADVRRAINL